jgi:hypothetical protein
MGTGHFADIHPSLTRHFAETVSDEKRTYIFYVREVTNAVCGELMNILKGVRARHRKYCCEFSSTQNSTGV